MDTASSDVVTVERIIAAPPAALFAIVADVSRHAEIDGSGSIIKPKAGAPQELTMGSSFGMSMKVGLPYSMTNHVIEFEPDRRIAWQTVAPGPFGRFIGGRIWRYQFEPVEGGTKVTESWDISRDKQRAIFKLIGRMASDAEKSIRGTLDRLATLTE